MFTVFDGEDIYDMLYGVKLIDNAIVSDPEGVFSLMVAYKGLAFFRGYGKGFYLCEDFCKEPSVGSMEEFEIGFGFPGKLNIIGHAIFSRVLKSFKATVLPALTCFLARATAARSSLRERISRVSKKPSNSSLLKITAASTPFLVMVNRSYFSSTSFMIADRLFLASASGMVFVMGVLLMSVIPHLSALEVFDRGMRNPVLFILTIIIVYLINNIQAVSGSMRYE